MEGIIFEFSKHNTIIFQNIPVIVILLATNTLYFASISFIFIDAIVGDIPISKEILDLEGVKLFFVLYDLYWSSFSLFCEKSDRSSLLKDADFWEKESNFTR